MASNLSTHNTVGFHQIKTKEKIMNIFESLISVVADVATIVGKPVEIVLEVAGAVTKPVAEVVTELTDDIKAALK